MAKRNLLGDCVLRRDSLCQLYLMNRQEGGWRSALFPVKSEEALLDEYNVRLGEWTKDECSEYCPVTRLSREEMDTLHDGEDPDLATFPFDDIGPRGSTPIDPNLEGEAFRGICEAYGFNKLNLLDDGLTQDKLRELLNEQHDFGPRGLEPLLVGDNITHREVLQHRGVGVEILHDLGHRGVVHESIVLGVGSYLNQSTDYSVGVELGKVSLTDEQHRVLTRDLVTVVVDGEVVREDSLEEIRARFLAQVDELDQYFNEHPEVLSELIRRYQSERLSKSVSFESWFAKHPDFVENKS
jgi:hypothetical protein